MTDLDELLAAYVAEDASVELAHDLAQSDLALLRRLIELRVARGLTQEDVAARMKRTQPAVSDFERLGGDPHLSTIRRYALAVGAKIEHVVTPNEHPRHDFQGEKDSECECWAEGYEKGWETGPLNLTPRPAEPAAPTRPQQPCKQPNQMTDNIDN